MPVETQCPSCGRSLRVPDDLLDKKVKCPSCEAVFTAREGAGTAVAADAAMIREPRHEEGGDDYSAYEQRERVRPRRNLEGESAVKGPGICLLITAILTIVGGLGCLGMSYVYLVMIDQVIEEMEKDLAKQGRAANRLDREEVRRVSSILGRSLLFVGAASLALALPMLIGSIQMLRVRSRGMAIFGSVAAVLPAAICCIMGIPVGIWSLVVLNKPEVRAAFEANA